MTNQFCIKCGKETTAKKTKMCRVCYYKNGGNRKGSKLTPKQLKIWSECKSGNKNYWYGKKLTNKHRKNISRSKVGIKLSKEFCDLQKKIRIKKQKKTPIKQWANFNETACLYFDWLNKWMGWNGHYATNYGEVRVGWWSLDYYEPNLNIVIEWDEQQHYDKRGRLTSSDKIREKQIKKRLKCKFYRIKEKDIVNGLWFIKHS